MAQDDIIKDFTAYLEKANFKKGTILTYKSKLRKYMKTHNIQNKDELKKQLTTEPQPPKGIAQAYIYTGLIIPYRKNLKKSKEYKKKPIIRYNPYKDPLITQFQKERNIRDSTMNGYTSSLTMYIPLCGFQDCSEMIQEALTDEKNRVPIKEARITEHLREYKRHLHDAKNVKSSHTLHTYFTKIETFYRHFQVTVPARPPMQIKKEYHVDYYDLPDKKMIETAINQSDLQLKAIIYFMTSSGTAKAETLSMTVQDFITGLKEYTTKTEPKEVIRELRGRKDLVPIIKMTRRKTNVAYHTCCSSEATYYILEYMHTHQRYNPDDKVFTILGSGLMKQFQILNDSNKWGRVGSYRRFRTHMLRKFHASNIGCSFEVINTLEGRTNGTIHETYVKTRPDKLKEVYMEHMHNVMIHPENFEGPHCGGQTIKGIVQDEVQKVKEDVGIREQIVQPVHTNAMGNDGVMNFELIKTIGKLEQRIEQLENRLTKLGG